MLQGRAGELGNGRGEIGTGFATRAWARVMYMGMGESWTVTITVTISYTKLVGIPRGFVYHSIVSGNNATFD